MKSSISVPPADVQLLDEFARTAGLPSRSAAVQHAIRLLRLPHLEHDYAAAQRLRRCVIPSSRSPAT